jgi:hypothetical protein
LGEEALSEEAVTEQRARLEVEINAELNTILLKPLVFLSRKKLKNGAEVFANGNDVIARWRHHRHKFPIISELARIVLTTPASQCDNERVFCAV